MKEKFPLKDSELKFPHAFLLDASAGSGKTYQLALRYIQFLLSDKIKNNNLNNILAVTFTDNATKEMKKRIINFLKEVYLKEEKRKEISKLLSLTEPALKQKADKILSLILYNYSDFYVGTIDSFITRIVSASSDELKIRQDYELIFENRQLLEETIEDFWFFLKQNNKTKFLKDFLDTLNATESKSFDFLPLDSIKEKFSEFLDKENKFLKKIKSVEKNDKKIKKLLEDIFKDALEMRNKYQKLSPQIYKACDEALNDRDYFKLIENYKLDSAIFKKQRIFKEKIEPDKFFIEINEEIKKNIALYFEIESETFFKAYSDLYKIFYDFFSKHRRNLSYLSLSEITKEISLYIERQKIPEIYLRLAVNFNHFLIDEFQDTSLAQWNIFRPLIENALSQNGSLFLIGDTKQAIYMFRNADYKIMAEFRKEENKYLDTSPLEKKVQRFSLETNYRSDLNILNYVKDFFSCETFKNYIRERIDSDSTGLLNCNQLADKSKGEGYVEVCVFDKEENEAQELLKNKFCEIIKDLINRFELRDIAVLVGTNDEVEEVVLWLNSMGIPCASHSSLDIRKRKIINEIFSLLRFLENPEDDFSFSSFLLGDIFNRIFSDKDKLLDFILENKDVNPIYIAFRENFYDIWKEYFDEIFSKADYFSAYELISLIYLKFQLYKNFPKEQAFLVKFSDIAYRLNVKEGALDISDILEFMENEIDEEKFSISLETSLNAINVMTFHKAKGLGFSAVVNLFKESRKPPENIYYLETEDGIELRRIVKSYRDFSNKLDSIYKNYEREVIIQDLNTLYVALTRAKHELYNLVSVKNGSEKIYSLFKDFKLGDNTKKYSKEEKLTQDFLPVSLNDKKIIYDFIKKGEADLFETLRGDFYHYVFSKIEDLNDINKIEKIIVQASFKFFRNSDIVSEALKKVSEIIAGGKLSMFFEEKKGRKTGNEVEFILENGKICRIDRFIEDIDKIIILDYKTGKKKDYSEQIEFYKKAILKYSSKPVFAFVFYIDLNELYEYTD